MAAILRMIFSDAFSWMKNFVYWLKFHWRFFLMVWQEPGIGLDNGLAPNRRQVIIWTNSDPIQWRIYAALGGDELSWTIWGLLSLATLTHWGQVMHICVGNLTIIGSDNGLSPCRRQAITWTNVGILLIGPLGTNLSEMLIKIHTFSFKKIHLKTSSGKWRPFCLGLNVLTLIVVEWKETHMIIQRS